MKAPVYLLAIGLAVSFGSCSSMKKSTSSVNTSSDSSGKKTEEAALVNKSKDTEKSSVETSVKDKTEASVLDKIKIVLDPEKADSSRDLVIDISAGDTGAVKSKGGSGKGYKIKVPANTKSIELITKRQDQQTREISGIKTDSSSREKIDSGGFKKTEEATVKKTAEDRKTKKARNSNIVGGSLFLLLLAGIYLYYQYRKKQGLPFFPFIPKL